MSQEAGGGQVGREVSMRRAGLVIGVLAVLAVAGLATVSGWSGAAQEKSSSQTTPPATLVIPEEEKNRKNPIPANAESLELGKKLFTYQCTMCHGSKGDGQGDLAQELKLAVPDFTNSEVQKKRTDGELHYILTEGHGRMPGQKTRLRPEQKWGMINYIRTLAPPAPKAPAKAAPPEEKK